MQLRASFNNHAGGSYACAMAGDPRQMSTLRPPAVPIHDCRDVLGKQLHRLVEAAELESVRLQVLPRGAGAHVAMGSGFTVLGFGDIGEPDLVYVEHALGALFMEKRRDVQRATLVFDRLRSAALSPEQSLALIRRAADQI